jgi:hypothetical protein
LLLLLSLCFICFVVHNIDLYSIFCSELVRGKYLDIGSIEWIEWSNWLAMFTTTCDDNYVIDAILNNWWIIMFDLILVILSNILTD